MKKILTALNNPKINEELKKEKNIIIIGKDILYMEGIFEILEKNKNIDLIIINYELIKDKNIKEILFKINKINRKIKIIIISEKNIENKIPKINYYIEKINKKNIIRIINNKEKHKGKIITISGDNGVGKTITITKMIKEINNNKKILIIDLNMKKQNLEMLILKNKKRNKRKNKKINKIKNIKNVIYKVKKNINFKINKITNNISIISWRKIYNMSDIKKLKSIYDEIIIEISENNKDKINNIILNLADENLIIIEANILGIYNFKNILNKYINKYKIYRSKIKIIINKINKNSINKNIIEKIINKNNFKDKIEVINEIKYEEKDNNYINNKF